MYAKVLAYIHLTYTEDQMGSKQNVGAYIEKNPDKKSITQIAETCTCCWQAHAYPITAGGKNHMASFVLSNLIWDQLSLSSESLISAARSPLGS